MTTLIDKDSEQMAACSNEVRAAVEHLMGIHDARLLFACLAAETGHLAALLRVSKVYQPGTVLRVLAEVTVTAMTFDAKPKVMYTDGTEALGRKQ